MNDSLLPGALEDFLQEPRAPAAGPLRAAVLGQTLGVLRRRQWRRRTLQASGVAAALVLAGLALHLGLRSQEDEPQVRPAPLAEQKRNGPQHGPQATRQAPAVAPKTPLEEEWAAFDAEAPDRARLYFQTGDRYLSECQDIESALRCYQQALRLSAADDLAFNPNDNWLVMALKQDHRKER